MYETITIENYKLKLVAYLKCQLKWDSHNLILCINNKNFLNKIAHSRGNGENLKINLNKWFHNNNNKINNSGLHEDQPDENNLPSYYYSIVR